MVITMRGFTLIEVMITVAIVAILAAIAYPSYVEHINRTRRAEAQATLMELAQWMEQRYMLNMGYNRDNQGNTLDLAQANGLLQTQIQNATISTYYDFEFTNIAGNAFTLNAAPRGTQAKDKCGTLTFNSLGQKGAKLSVQECW